MLEGGEEVEIVVPGLIGHRGAPGSGERCRPGTAVTADFGFAALDDIGRAQVGGCGHGVSFENWGRARRCFSSGRTTARQARHLWWDVGALLDRPETLMRCTQYVNAKPPFDTDPAAALVPVQRCRLNRPGERAMRRRRCRCR